MSEPRSTSRTLVPVWVGVLVVVLGGGTTAALVSFDSPHSANPTAGPGAQSQAAPTTQPAESLFPLTPLTGSPGTTRPTTTQPTAIPARSTAAVPSTADPAPRSSAPAAAETSASHPPPFGNIEIQDSVTGFGLDDSGGTTAGTLLGTTAIGTWPVMSQQWHFVQQPTGDYVVYWAGADLSEGLDVNTRPASYGGDAIAMLAAYRGDSHMQWEAAYVGEGEYELINAWNHQCLQGAVQGGTASTAPCSTDAHQLWEFVRHYPPVGP